MARLTSSWKPEVTRRNSETALPSCLAALGRRSGPRTISATRKITRISGAPRLPTRAMLPGAHVLHGVSGPGRVLPDGHEGRLQLTQALDLRMELGGLLDGGPQHRGDGSRTGAHHHEEDHRSDHDLPSSTVEVSLSSQPSRWSSKWNSSRSS